MPSQPGAWILKWLTFMRSPHWAMEPLASCGNPKIRCGRCRDSWWFTHTSLYSQLWQCKDLNHSWAIQSKGQSINPWYYLVLLGMFEWYRTYRTMAFLIYCPFNPGFWFLVTIPGDSWRSISWGWVRPIPFFRGPVIHTDLQLMVPLVGETYARKTVSNNIQSGICSILPKCKNMIWSFYETSNAIRKWQCFPIIQLIDIPI